MAAPTPLLVNKIANQSEVAPGCNVSFNVQVTNPGTTTVSNVLVRDAVPPGTTLVSFTATPATGFTLSSTTVCAASSSGPCSPCSNEQACRGSANTTQAAGDVAAFGSLAPMTTVNFCLVVRVNPDFTGVFVTNNITVTASGQPTTTSSASVLIVPNAELQLCVTGPRKAPQCAPVTFRIELTNRGPSSLINVIVNDLVPPGTGFVTAQSCSGPLFTIQQQLSIINFVFASLPACSTAVWTVTFAPLANACNLNTLPIPLVPPCEITNHVTVGVQPIGTQVIITHLSRNSKQSATTRLVQQRSKQDAKRQRKVHNEPVNKCRKRGVERK
jgi:uncharacterized repeat protein (TIGR01451 family)